MADIGLELDIRQKQALMMTPAMQQSLRILQLSTIELNNEIQKELLENPLLETGDSVTTTVKKEDITSISEEPTGTDTAADFPTEWTEGRSDTGQNSTDRSFNYTDITESKSSLRDYLIKQLRSKFGVGDWQEKVGLQIIDSIDESGYLRKEVVTIAEETGASIDEVGKILQRMQEFEPVGIFARSLQELLKIGLKDKGLWNRGSEIVLEHLDLVGQQRYSELAKKSGLSPEEVLSIHQAIKTLDPKPAADFIYTAIPTLIPDVIVNKDRTGQWKVEINPLIIPKLLINQKYSARLHEKGISNEEKEYLSQKLKTANLLLRALDMRKKTIVKMVAEIVTAQKKFFETGDEQKIIPLRVVDIAQNIDMNPSTVSRAMKEKFMSTPYGVLPFNYFLSGIASKDRSETKDLVSKKKIKSIIKSVIDDENKNDPLRDADIVEILQAKGYNIKRRTVAKYREEMKIPTFGIRKKFNQGQVPP